MTEKVTSPTSPSGDDQLNEPFLDTTRRLYVGLRKPQSRQGVEIHIGIDDEQLDKIGSLTRESLEQVVYHLTYLLYSVLHGQAELEKEKIFPPNVLNSLAHQLHALSTLTNTAIGFPAYDSKYTGHHWDEIASPDSGDDVPF